MARGSRPDVPYVPQVIVILGVDGAGKDHVAEVVAAALEARGVGVERRCGYLSSAPRPALTGAVKPRRRLAAERLFLAAFPVMRPLVPAAAELLVRLDLRRSRRATGPPGAVTVLVSYTPLRIAAFALSASPPGREAAPRGLDAVLRRLAEAVPVRSVVLCISPEVRRARMGERARSGRIDPFDRYLVRPEHAEHAERFEAALVDWAQRCFGAELVRNDDLDDAAIVAAVLGDAEMSGGAG